MPKLAYRAWHIHVDGQTDLYMYGQSHDIQNFLDRWVTKFP